jgi:hypothetical protein
MDDTGEKSTEDKVFFQSSSTTLFSNAIELIFVLSLWWTKHNTVCSITFTMIFGETVSVCETLCVPNTSQIMDNILDHILIMKAINVEMIHCACYVEDKDIKLSKFEFELMIVVLSYLDHWGDLGVDGWIILGWISRRWDVGMWTGLG